MQKPKATNDKQQIFVPLGKKHKSVNLGSKSKDKIAESIKEANIDSYQDDIETFKKAEFGATFY